MRISVDSKYEASPLATALGSLFSEVSLICADLPEFIGNHVRDAEVVVTLGGTDQCDHWHVRPDALGFHAVATGTQYDSLEDEFRGINGWIDVNERNEAVVNMTAAVELCIDQIEEEADVSFMISMMVTPIHELMHVAEFLERSRGRCPVEVYDEDQGQDGLRAILGDDGTEDRVESISLRIAEELHSSYPGLNAKMEEVLRLAIEERRASLELSI